MLALGDPPCVCLACRTPYYRGLRRCPNCQVSLPVRVRVCATCGTTELPPRVKFCSDPCRETGALSRPSARPVAVRTKVSKGVRRAEREAAAPGFATAEQLTARWAYFAGRCWMCGAPATCMDHVKPLARGGSNWASNQRPACSPCNRRKNQRWPFDYSLLNLNNLGLRIPRGSSL